MQLKEFGEFKLIDTIARLTASSTPSLIKGIGDDAAVVRSGETTCLLVTTDILTEGIHFRNDCGGPYLLGKKSISVNLSDIAAMGGSPLYFVVGLSAPPETSVSFIKELYRGMDRQARRFNVFLAGGDTTSSSAGITISITLFGSADKERVVYRHGAQEGDLVYVTGSVGDSALGLLMLEKRGRQALRHRLVRRHLDPVPRVEAGQRISRLKTATGMIDISDGLMADLRHILNASDVGATIRLSAIPLSAGYRKQCPLFSDDFYYPALCGGEDYELLFTVNPKQAGKVQRLSRQLKLAMSCIGEITKKKSGLVLLDKDGRRVSLRKEGYAHF